MNNSFTRFEDERQGGTTGNWQEVIVASLQQLGSGSNRGDENPIESVSLTFTNVSITYGTDSKGSGSTTGKWQQVTNTQEY